MSRSKRILAMIVVGVLAVAGTAAASVSFDASSGTGFVGKGDVQLAYGWNNQALQAKASGVTFTYNATDTYSADCTFQTGNPDKPTSIKTHVVTIPRHTSVDSTIQYDVRTHKQIDGFVLKGFGATTTDGIVPVAGNACVANDDGINHDGTWTAVTLTGSTGGLFVNYGGTSLALPNTL